VAEQRLSRKEIRQPDQFVSLSVQIVGWIKGHISILIYGVVAMAIVATLIIGWWAWQRHREQQADTALYEATKFIHTRSANRPKAVEQLQRLVHDYGSTAAALAHWHLEISISKARLNPAALTAYRQARQRLGNCSAVDGGIGNLDIAYAQKPVACVTRMPSRVLKLSYNCPLTGCVGSFQA
jgi:hypothetical protein